MNTTRNPTELPAAPLFGLCVIAPSAPKYARHGYKGCGFIGVVIEETATHAVVKFGNSGTRRFHKSHLSALKSNASVRPSLAEWTELQRRADNASDGCIVHCVRSIIGWMRDLYHAPTWSDGHAKLWKHYTAALNAELRPNVRALPLAVAVLALKISEKTPGLPLVGSRVFVRFGQ